MAEKVVVRKDGGVTYGDVIKAYHAGFDANLKVGSEVFIRLDDGCAVTLKEMEHMQEAEQMDRW